MKTAFGFPFAPGILPCDSATALIHGCQSAYVQLSLSENGFCVTAAALHYCVSRHVELFISNEMTGFISLFAPESRIDARYAALKARQKQFAAALDDARTISVARTIVAMKVQAEGHRNFAEQQFLKSVDNAESVGDVRRIEALSGTAFWRQRQGFELAFKGDAPTSWRRFETRYIGRRLGKLGELDKRFTARHASQPMQAMLNFAISISAARMTRCIIACGLDASFGFLHNARKPGRLSLVWDCIEPLRPALACAVFKYAGKRTFERADFINLENKKGEKVVRLSPKTAKDIVPIALGASPIKECFRIVNTVISHF